jgi:hypothetical protein
MVEAMKNNESDSESEQNEPESVYFIPGTDQEFINKRYHEQLCALEKRILALERVLIHVQHYNTEDGSRHQNDGGWFE